LIEGWIVVERMPRSESRSWGRRTGTVATIGIALVLMGCFGSERRAQEADIAERRTALGPGYETDTAASVVIREREAETDIGPALRERTTLGVVRDAAVRRNPDLKVALERWVAFLERVQQKTALPFPTVRYGYSSMFKMHTVEGMQEVPFPTKLLADGRAALAEASAMQAEYRERENVLREQASSAYAILYLARREVGIVEENLALLDRFVAIARSKYEAGTASQPDVLRAEVERETLRTERAALAGQIQVATSALNILLDRLPDATVGTLTALPVPATAAATVTPTAGTGLLDRALEVRPELLAAVQRSAAADAMLSRAEQERIPDFVVGGAYVRDFGMDENQLELSAGISIPLWWGRINAGIAEAEADARRSRAELRVTRNRVLDEVKSASARLVAAAEQFRILDHETVPRAEQNVKASEAAYVAGQIDFLALIDSQRMLLMKRIERERALADYTMRTAELERTVGGGAGR